MKIRKSLLVEAAKDRPQGYLEDVYSHVESEDTEFVYISNASYILLKNKYTTGLPGTELKKLISWFYSPNKKCNCLTRIAKMNKWGPDKCEQRIDTIIRWLKHSARIASVPFFEPAVRLLIKQAIKNSRKEK